ncbi:MAG: glycosyltransferase family 2 protein [Bacteroidetes bacterium]|nr:glycosyltransferase family 2 protein [Bacteroidota bacterium]
MFSLLRHLNQLSYPLEEIIIVDSGEELLDKAQYELFTNLNIQYILSQKSVCVQRNTGIRMACSPWVFLCDDDIEMPPDYLTILTNHLLSYPECGAVSGAWLQKEDNEWKGTYPVRSIKTLFGKIIFQQGIWGEICCLSNSFFARKIRNYYVRKGNHISKAGWPVNTDFRGDFFTCAVYSLGASLVKKDWLLQSPYDEILDQYGIGDNYGVILGFPSPVVHVVNKTFVHHHREPTNRLKSSLQYYRRVMALDYFRRLGKTPGHVKKGWLLWSLAGSCINFFFAGQWSGVKITIKSIRLILFNRNPNRKAAKKSIE